MILTPAELVDLTGRIRSAYQARVLDGTVPPIPYRKRPDGTLIVHWEDVRLVRENARLAPREPRVRMDA